MKRIMLGLAAAVLSVASVACGWMPEEEVLPEAPVIQEYEETEYKQTAVMRGDLMVVEVKTCTYVPAKQVTLGFAKGGEVIDKIYVREGQSVKAGELLAELDYGNLLTEIPAKEYEIRLLQTKRTHLLERQDLDLKYASGEERTALQQSYAGQLQELDDALYVQGIKLQELKNDVESRRIYAVMDGTVTYLRTVLDGQVSVKNQELLTISDMNSTVFVLDGNMSSYFGIGQKVTIQYKKEQLTAFVEDPSVLGLAQEGQVCFRLEEMNLTLEEGARGGVQMVLDESKDTLYVEKEAVKLANGEPFVYMLDENGLKVMQPVTTGLKNSDYIEITDGLKEGDLVIVE